MLPESDEGAETAMIAIGFGCDHLYRAMAEKQDCTHGEKPTALVPGSRPLQIRPAP